MDSDNILSILAALGKTPMAPQPVPEGGITPVSYQPIPDPPEQSISNVLQAVAAPQAAPAPVAAPIPQAAPAPAAPATPAEPPRKRRSVIETIGRLADVFARVGGAEALYEPTLNARADRGFAQEDRARQIEMDKLKLAVGKFELGDIQNARLGQFARGLKAIQVGGGDINTALPILGQRMGLDPETIQSVQQEIATNPNALDGLIAAAAETQRQGSLPASLQNYAAYQQILAQQGPEAAKEFMRFVQPEMEAIKPYQQAQLAMDEREFRRQLVKDQRDAANAEREFRLKEAKTATGGADLTPTQRGVVNQKLKLLPTIRQQLNRVRDLQREMRESGTLARGAIGGLLPGAIAGGKAERFDKALGALRKSILALTRVPGIGSMSNYETALDEMALPSRWGSDEGRAEAIQGIDQLVSGLETGYKELVPQGSARSAAPRSGGGNRGIPTLKNPSEVKNLPPGTRFRTPDGQIRISK